MSFFFVDVETDGPCPGLYSMIEIGVIMLEPDTKDLLSIGETSFYSNIAPISDLYMPEALAVTGHERNTTLAFREPEGVMDSLYDWVIDVNKTDRPKFVSDNAGFDWQFVNYYFWKYLNKNPFGHSSLSLTSLYKGFDKSLFSSFKHLRDTKHTHNPLDDAKGNAEAFFKMKQMGLKVKL